jgi:glycosyltransferase involved in cell wall biosynthesis
VNETRKCTVITLASSYPRNDDDTAALFIKHLCTGLSGNNIEMPVITPSDKESSIVREGDVVVHRFQYFPLRFQSLAYGSGMLPNIKQKPLRLLQVPFYLFFMFIALVRLTRKLRPDILHAHWIFPQGFIAVLCRLFYKVPVITTAHGSDVFALGGIFLGLVKRFTLKHSATWTANTASTARRMTQEYRNLPTPVIIPMGIDADHFRKNTESLPSLYQKADGKIILLFVGRLIEIKGVHILIEAFTLLPDTIKKNAVLWIIGDGDEKSSLQEKAKELGIENSVSFVGTVNYHNINKYYSAADIFIGPSVQGTSGETEGQGVVFLEAFASCLPVIASKIGGIVDIIDHEQTGLLVDAGNAQQLAGTIATLLSDEALQKKLTDNALNLVKQQYTWPHIRQKFLEIYLEITRSDQK